MKQINKYLYRVSADDFQKIPGSSIAYWMGEKFFNLFESKEKIERFVDIKFGMRTGDNDQFLRHWHEVSTKSIYYRATSIDEFVNHKMKWLPYAKGGFYRKWFGNHEYIVLWENEGKAIKENTIKQYPDIKNVIEWKITNERDYLKQGLTWSRISSTNFGVRLLPEGFIFSDAACAAFPKQNFLFTMAFFVSRISSTALSFINPTLTYQINDIKQIPFICQNSDTVSVIEKNAYNLLNITNTDWDSYETSWDFMSLPLLDATYRGDSLVSNYENLRAHWNEMTLEMQRLEEENNHIFIEAYGLEDELTPDVPLKEITLTCNPYYRYGDNKSDSELEELLLADTMKELISYAVGCMFGRYSLDKPGLILANQGETYEDYCRLVPESSFPADEDNAIPVLDGDWFSDDIVSRFRKFLRVAFGEEKYEENLRFVEAALGKDLRQYFLRDFYNDHVKRYKKRPIYWMFSSPDGNFNVLIYMHRYRPDTASIILSEYLREYQVRLSAYMDNLRRKEANPDLSKGEKVKALKELDKLRKTQDALTAYERDILFPLANQRIEIDLDDGVKVNYPKFGVALKKIAGLEAKDEE